MKKLIPLFLLAAAFPAMAFVADCTDFDFTEGTSMTMTSYDGKDKVISAGTTTIKKITKGPGSTVIDMYTELKDDKGAPLGIAESSMTCADGKISLDMRNFASSTMTSQKDMTITLEGNMIDYPSGLTAGATLPDATMIMHSASGGKEVSATTIKIYNRKVEAVEAKTTPAGTWNCYKISYTHEASMKFGTINMNVVKPTKAVEWFSFQVGTVRTESYKDGKIESYSQLTTFQKP